jgi:hypothetical protein
MQSKKMIEILSSHSEVVIAFLSAALGAILGFFGSIGIWLLERRRQRSIARMQVVINLRRWLQRTLYRMSDVQTYLDSRGAGGAMHTTLQNFRFEKSLDQVAMLEHRVAVKIFELIHDKDNTNTSVEFEHEYGDDDFAIDKWRGHSAQVWLKVLEIYDQVSTQIGWSERAFSDENKKMMKDEVDRFHKIESASREIIDL